MGYQIRIERRAEKALVRLTRRDRRRIIKAIDDAIDDFSSASSAQSADGFWPSSPESSII
jgi:mRNA-degrading endonuclease RelE of RelBE toxin-antitoxin system